MDERKEIFDKYINSFKILDIEDKKNEIIYSLKELIAIFDKLCENENIKIEYLKSNEILDVQENNNLDNDFLEAIFVYLEISKDIIGQYFVKSFNNKK